MARPQNTSRTLWTPDEDAVLLGRIEAGEAVEDIANSFLNRSYKAVLSRWNRLRPENDPNDSERKTWPRRSEELRRATMAMLSRIMSDTGKEMDEVMGMVLGEEPAKKTAITRHIHKTSSMERQVNAVQALGMAA
jgi:hypothetical protein